ncbi:MAG: HNH endonuclease [Thiobacillus sp.]
MVGSKSPAWKDGKSLDRERARYSGALAEWKHLVKERDEHKCVKCGDESNLHAHHIKSFSDFPDLASDVDNGITLCEFCHSVEHGRWIGAKSRNKRWQEFTGKQATLESDGRTFAEVSDGS